MTSTNPSASPPPSPPQHHQQQHHRLKVHTHHCRFCNHLLLATTRTIAALPRRKDPAQDSALILPLPHADADADADDDDEPDASPEATSTEGQGERKKEKEKQKQKHYTILLSTTLPDRKATLIRREDGFEKRRFLRCGRCRVVVGYFLDAVHFPVAKDGRGEDELEGEESDQEPRVVYLLPGALIETETMGDEEKMRVMDREWSGWIPQ
ncbi:uncharacterized protein CDV56_103864 [Aspergillus thermomutatus]|uniref:STEEP1 domain-containing protein n=1 Tax=Aspergillus thermomutatus TaxID=41047 RepID=A0A397GRV4_ASPTH|nr:uncharacterized protein CDV56_103864 [Aspergillus thermomutatus]RHZ50790.1 hypothetical protein CDV56_103864 [Aspergillus thermomutatus]